MGGERVRRGRGTPARTVAYAACGAVLLAGCASMPDSGDLRGVESTPRKDTQVRVYAMPPSDDATPAQIVQGFLEALTSDDADYKTARQYLTPEASKYWRPEQSTTVLSDGPGARADREPREDSTALTYTLTGTKFATVDAQQAYAPASGQYSELVRLVKDDKSGQWRIDAVPQGVVMGKSDFQRNYTSFNKYYFASNVDVNGSSLPMAVADPVYVRRHVDPTTRMVRSLISGPTSWLDPVVRSSFPTGTQLRKGAGPLTPDDRGTLTVPLNDRASEIGTGRCEEMAAQLLFTLRGLSPAVEEVELRADGGQLCSLTQDGAETVATRGALNQPDHLYFLDREHKLVRIAAGSAGADPEAAPGALGQGEQGLRSVAVARDERMAAGVGLNGQELFVSALAQGATLGEPVLRSQGKTEQDRLTPPSWDAQGGLWVADRDPARPGLYLLPQGADQPLQVRTPGLEGRIRAVRVAADGVRIALVVEKGDERSLLVGRIERSGPDEAGSSERTTVTVVELRSATPELEQVTAMSWAGDSRLVVVGREHGGVEQMKYVEVDGSTPDVPPPAALTGVKALTAAGDENAPLVAYSVDGIVRLPSGAQWQKVTQGTAPVYPG
ncbi:MULTISPECIES: LpqB family beta-propeller domain-containing protein [Streptomyces]|uniref:LpqB family beta-propeller domain-containing protein n=2 Tax=Streptomyces TaxID=1883 RepID=UPI000A777C75|nr:LpqB family beta-propeller domain-containing protein [Streptomyces sp. F-7]